jgi:thiol-disulfide isomerase/thioredoxin
VTEADAKPGGTRPKTVPLSAVVLAAVAATLATALVVSLLTGGDDGGTARETVTLQPGDPTNGIASGVDLSGTQAPEFRFEPLRVATVEGNADIDFSDYRAGRPMMLNFFGSWCAPCVQEMPALQSVSEELADEVVFLGLAERDTVENALEIVDRTGVTYDIGRDPGGDILTAFEGLAMPTTVFIAANGTITSVHSGALTADELRSRIADELL